jgi:hypothetical protein
VLKKSGIILAALVLSTFTLASSAFAQTAQAPTPQTPAASTQAVQPCASALPFELAPAVQTPAMTPVKTSGGLAWLGDDQGKPACRCKKNSECGTGACCWWPHQSCGICCPPV